MSAPETLSLDALRALDDEHVMPTYRRQATAFVRGEGTRLWDSEGREYLDFVSGLAVASLGHAHPEVADALSDQARSLVHVSNLYYNDVQPRLARELDGLLGGGGKLFFANSGAEANECAIKLARRWSAKTGRGEAYEVVSADNSFHGRTLATLAATGQPDKQEPFRPLPAGFSQVPYGEVAALESALHDGVCAVLLEPVQGEGGIHPAPDGYLQAARKLSEERGILLVCDEVQTGLGRTGRWFGFEHAGIRPDVVTVAKALGNGVPIGACWAAGPVGDAFSPGDHATTFGGQPLAARAALTVLEIMQREQVPDRAAQAGKRLATGLSELAGVREVKGLGLLLGAVLEPGVSAQDVVGDCLAEGLLVNAVTGDTVRLAPPLLVADDEIERALEILSRVLAGLVSQGASEIEEVGT